MKCAATCRLDPRLRLQRQAQALTAKHSDSFEAGNIAKPNRSLERKTRRTSRKYYPPYWPRSLSGAAFRAMTGRTVRQNGFLSVGGGLPPRYRGLRGEPRGATR